MGSIDEQILSKSSKLGGYEKRPVLSYIDSLREDFTYEKQQLEKRNRELEKNNEELSAQVFTLEKRINTLENRLYEEQNRVGNLNITINQLNVEIASQRVVINERERQLGDQKNESRHSSEQARLFAVKAKKYDDIKDNIGAIILEAKSSAHTIIEKSQARSREITKSAEEKLNTINADIIALRHQLAMGRKFLLDLTRTVSDKMDNMEIVVNSVDHSVNYDTVMANNATKLQDILKSDFLDPENAEIKQTEDALLHVECV